MSDGKQNSVPDIPAVKDPQRAHPVPAAWRPLFRDTVRALVNGDFGLRSVIPQVEAVDDATAKQIQGYIEEYGQRLTELPEDTWQSSVAQWGGGYWDVLVDLWTVEAGRSDLVLSARVFEEGDSYRIRVDGVYVP